MRAWLYSFNPTKNEKLNGVIQHSYSLVDISVIRSAGDNMRIYSSSCVRQFWDIRGFGGGGTNQIQTAPIRKPAAEGIAPAILSPELLGRD